MPDAGQLWDHLQRTFTDTLHALIERTPGIAGGLALLLLGWLAARLVRHGAIRLLHLVNGLLARGLTGQTRAAVHFSTGITELIGGVLFWLTLFVFVAVALDVAGFTGIATWLENVVTFLPTIVTGGAVILIGYILSVLVREMTLAAGHSARLEEAVVLSRLAQATTLVTTLIIGLELIGLDVTFLTTILGVATAALLAGFAIAFGLGARTLVSNLIAVQHLRGVVEPGQRVRLGRWEGTVLELSATTIILDTAEGRTAVPAKLYQEEGLVVLLADGDDD